MTNYFRDVAFITGAALTFAMIIIAPAVPILAILLAVKFIFF